MSEVLSKVTCDHIPEGDSCGLVVTLIEQNAKLRERVEELEELLPENGRWFSAEVVEAYVAEIKKLRELVDGLEYCVQGLVCDCCPLYDPSGTNHRRCESLERELGVEVD